MNTEIAQLVALVSYCNAAVRGMSTPAFGLEHSTCSVCAHVTFTRPGLRLLTNPDYGLYDDPGGLEYEDANTPFEWLVQLVRTRPHGLRLVYEHAPRAGVPDRYLSALTPGSGNWYVEVATRSGISEFWSARWQVAEDKRLDRRIWDVSYVCVGRDKTQDVPPNLRAADDLRAILLECEALALDQNADSFATAFRTAIAQLEGHSRGSAGHGDLVPEGLLDEDASRLLDAAQNAWVFGGAGSWNDLAFEGEAAELYNELSDRLWRAVTAAVVQATNSTYVRPQLRRRPLAA